jgi:MFS family permease
VAPATGARSGRSILLASYASFLLIGWTGLFVPSLLRVLQVDFEQTDASFGLVYLVIALLFAAGALSSGLIAQRVGRRVVLPAAALLVAGGMTLEGLAPTWPVFLIGAASAEPAAARSTLSSSVIWISRPRVAGGLNLLHLFYSVGALAAPLNAWAFWSVSASTGGCSLSRRARRGRPCRASRAPGRCREGATGRVPPDAERGPTIPVGLRLAGARYRDRLPCRRRSERPSWLVGFLDTEPMPVATPALAFGRARLAVGSSRAGSPTAFEPVAHKMCALVGGLAILAALAVSAGPIRSACSSAGFAFGPVYPMILSVAGSFFRTWPRPWPASDRGQGRRIDRYPPLKGLIADAAGPARACCERPRS